MTKQFVKAELKQFAATFSNRDKSWLYLLAYSAKLVALINDANELNCDPQHIETLTKDLLSFQAETLNTLKDINLKFQFVEPELRKAAVKLNKLKARFLAVCAE